MDNCWALNKIYQIGRQKCTLPVQFNGLGGKRFAGVSEFIILKSLSEKVPEVFVKPINFFMQSSFPDCESEKVWRCGQNCILLVQRKISALFYWKFKLLQKKVSESQKFSAELSELHSTCPEWPFGRNSFFWSKKKFFCCLFHFFAEKFLDFGYLSGTEQNVFRTVGEILIHCSKLKFC